MLVELKSGYKYDFKNIKFIKVKGEKYITINGNLENSRKYRDVELTEEMIEPISYKKLMKHAKNNMKAFEFVGICPDTDCNSSSIIKKEVAIVKTRVNDPRQKEEIHDKKLLTYYCEGCKKKLTRDQIKYVDIIIYSK